MNDQQESKATGVLLRGIRLGLVLLLWMPVVVTPQTLVPFIVGKALYARAIIEIVGALWVVLMVQVVAYRPRGSRVLAAFAVYVAASWMSAVAGVNPTHSFWSDFQRMMGVWGLLHWLALVVILSSVLKSRDEWRSLFSWNLAVALFLSLVAIAQAYDLNALHYIAQTVRVPATLGNATYLAGLLAVTTLIAVGLLACSWIPDEPDAPVKAKRKKRRDTKSAACDRRRDERVRLMRQTFWAVTAVCGVWVLILTAGRGGMVGLVAGAVAMPVALYIWGNRAVLKPVTIGATATIVSLGGLFAADALPNFSIHPNPQEAAISERVATSLEDAGVVTRLKLVGIGWRAFEGRPLLGWGQENFARVFDRFADASFYRYYQGEPQDRAHNQVLEELVTKGAVGFLAFAFMWVVLVWAVVRTRRRPRDEVLAYAVLGALVAHFVQNLFLFDTPATILQWTLLVGWVAADEEFGNTLEPDDESAASPMTSMPAFGKLTDAVGRALSPPAVRWGVGTAALVLVAGSLYSFNYRPYRAAVLAGDAIPQGPIGPRLEAAVESFETFPKMAALPRRYLMSILTGEWAGLSVEDRRRIIPFVSQEFERGLAVEPNNGRLLAAGLPMLQAVATTMEELERLDSLVQRLARLAPDRVETHQILAAQALEKGNYAEAIRIADAFEARAFGVEDRFVVIRRVAGEGLGAAERNR